MEGLVTDEKGGSRKRGGQDPLTPPPSGHAYADTHVEGEHPVYNFDNKIYLFQHAFSIYNL